MISKLIWPAVLQLIGVGVIIAEFILPSAGLLTIAALSIFGYSLYLVFTGVNVSAGITLLVIDILSLPVLVIIGIKLLAISPATLKTNISSRDGGVSQPESWADLKGKEGIALTDLHPTGAALFDSKRFDVVSRGEYIEKGITLIVTTVDGNRIVVRKKDLSTETD